MINEDTLPIVISLVGGLIIPIFFIAFETVLMIFVSIFIGILVGFSTPTIKKLSISDAILFLLSILIATAYILATSTPDSLTILYGLAYVVMLASILPSIVIHLVFTRLIGS